MKEEGNEDGEDSLVADDLKQMDAWVATGRPVVGPFVAISPL